jgi:hypothetical protein
MPDTYSDWSAKNPIADQVESLRRFNDYSRAEYLRAGQLTPELNDEMDRNAFQYALDKGVIPAPADDAEFQESYKGFVMRPQPDNVLALAGDKLSDEGDNDGAMKVKSYLAAKKQAGTEIITDQEAYAARLEGLRKEAEPYLGEDFLNNAKRYAIKSGRAKFATVVEDGKYRVIADPALGELDDNTIASYAAANPDLIDSRALLEVQRSFRKIPGLDVTPAQLERKSDLESQIVALANRDPGVMQDLEAAVKGFNSDNRTTGKTVVDTVFGIPATVIKGVGGMINQVAGGGPMKFETAPQTVEAIADRLSRDELGRNAAPDEILSAVRDFTVARGIDSVEFDEKNPAASARRLSTGMYAIPKRIQVNKELFNKTLDALPVSKEQRAIMSKEREANLNAYAKELIPQLIQADGSIADDYQKAKDAGKSEGEIIEQIAASGKYNGAANRAESLGLATLRVVTDLIPAVGATLPGPLSKPIKDLGYSISEKISEEQSANAALAGVFGKDFGWAQQLVEQVPQLAADIFISRGAGRVAGAAGKLASTSGRVAASTLLGAETAELLANFTKRAAGRTVSVVGKSAADGFAKALKAAPNEIGWLTSQGAREFGSTYSSTRSSLEAQLAPDGSKKFSPEQVESIATEAAALSAFWSNAVTLGFNRIGGGKLAGVETLATGRGISLGKLKSYYDDVVKGVEKLSPEVRSQISLADFDTFAKDVVKTALAPAKEVLFGAIGEGAEEFIQTVASDVVQSAVTGKNFDLTDSTRSAALAASFGFALGSAGEVVSLAEQRYLADPAYKQAEFEASYLGRTIENLKANGAPATAAFLQRQLDIAQQNKETIRTRFTQFAADEEAAAQAQAAADAEEFDVFARSQVNKTRPLGLPVPEVDAQTADQIRRTRELQTTAARLDALITKVESGIPEEGQTDSQKEVLAQLRARRSGIDDQIKQVGSTITSGNAAITEPSGTYYGRYEAAPNPATTVAPQNLSPVEGDVVETAGQFEFPFMARWNDLGVRLGGNVELAPEDSQLIDKAQMEFGFVPEAEAASRDAQLSPAERSIKTLFDNTTPEERAAFQQRSFARQGRYQQIGARVEEIDNDLAAYDSTTADARQRFDFYTKALADLNAKEDKTPKDAALAGVYQAKLDEATGVIAEADAAKAELESEKADLLEFAVGEIVSPIVTPEAVEEVLAAAMVEVPEPSATEKPATTATKRKVAKARAVQAVVEVLETSENPKALLDAAVEAVSAAPVEPAAAPKTFGYRSSVRPPGTPTTTENAPAEVSKAGKAPAVKGVTSKRPAESNAPEGVAPRDSEDQEDLSPRSILDEVLAEEAAAKASKKKLRQAAADKVAAAAAKFTMLDVEPLLDKTSALKSLGKGQRSTREFLADTSSPAGFLSHADYVLYQGYLEKGEVPKLNQLQSALSSQSYGYLGYTGPFYRSLKRDVQAAYPVYEAPVQPTDVTSEDLDITFPLAVRLSSIGQKLQASKIALEASLETRLNELEQADAKRKPAARAAVKRVRDAILRVEGQIADRLINGDYQFEREPDSGEVRQAKRELVARAREGGEVVNIELAVTRENGELVGFHTNSPQMTAWLLNNGFSIRVPKAQLEQRNPSIKVNSSRYVTKVELPDGTVVRRAGDLKAPMSAYVPEEIQFVGGPDNLSRPYVEFTESLPKVPPSLTRLFGKSPSGQKSSGGIALGEEVWMNDASLLLLGGQVSNYANILESTNQKLRANGFDESDFAFAVLARYHRDLREFALAIRVEEQLAAGRDPVKFLLKQVGPAAQAQLIKTFSTKGKTKLNADQAMKVYADRLVSELNGTDEGVNTRFFKKLADGTTIRRPNSLKTTIAQVEKKYFNRIKEQGSFIDPTARVEAADTPAILSQVDADELAASMYAAIARPLYMGVDNAAVEAVATIYDVIEESEKPTSLDEVITAVTSNIDSNPQVRKAFERAATTFGVTKAESLPTEALIDVFRNELSADMRAAAQRAKQFLLSNKGLEMRRVVEATLKPIADFEAFVREQAAQIGLKQDLASKREADRAAKSKTLSPEMVEMQKYLFPSEPGPSRTVVSRPVPERFFTPEEPQGVSVESKAGRYEVFPSQFVSLEDARSIIAELNERALNPDYSASTRRKYKKKAAELRSLVESGDIKAKDSDSSVISLPSGATYTRPVLRTMLAAARAGEIDNRYTQEKQAQFRRFGDTLQTLLASKKRNFKVGEDIKAVFESAAVPSDPATNLRNNLLDAEDLGLRGGSILSAIEALDKVPLRLKEVASLLKAKRDILAKANIEIVNLPNTGWAGKYSPESNTIFLNLAASNGRGLADVLVHEMLHAVTVSVIKSPDSAGARALVAKLDALRGRIKSAYNGNSQQVLAGLASLEEFVSYAFTSPDFQKAIYETAPERGFFRRFLDFLTRFLTGSPTDQLSKALNDLTKLVGMANMRPYGTRISEDVAMSRDQQTSRELPEITATTVEQDEMSKLLTQESPSGITIQYDESARGMMVARPSSPDTVFVNPQLLANAIAGLDDFNARRFVRAAVNHEIAHLAAFSTLSDADIDYIATTLPAAKLWEVADRYYSASIPDAAARFERIREDRASGKLGIRELADEFVRMEIEKARSGFISESDYSFYRRNPGILSRMLRALEAFIAKLTTRIRGIEDSQIAASVQRATRVYDQLVSPAEPTGFEEQLNVLRRDDVTGRFSLPVKNYGDNSYDVGGKFSRLFKGDLPSSVKALVGSRDSQLRLVARIAEQFNNQMQAFIKSGVINDENLTLVRNAMGDTGLVISKARMAQIEAVLDGEIANIEKTFEDSAKTESDKLIHDKGIADSVARHKSRVVKEYQLIADKARAAAAEAKAKLPPKVVKVIEDARAAIDKASGKIATNPFTPDDIRAVIDANMGIYLTRSYYAFTQTGWTKLLKSAGIAQVGNSMIDFQKIRDDALRHYTNKASKTLEAEIKKEHPEFSPAEIKAAVLRDTPARAQVMFDEFVASMDKNAASLATGQILAVDVEKALFEEGATEPVVRSARANELRQELGRFMEKSELPAWLRAALGEITDPIEAATRSLISVSKLAANQDLLTSTLEAGLDGGWITKDPVVANQKGYVKLSGANPAYDAPLDGAYGPPEFKKAFDTIFSKSSPELEDTADQAVRNGIKVLRAAAGGAMAAKTLLSVGFYTRNAVSDFAFFAPLQGVLLNPLNFKRWFQSKGSSFAKTPGEHEAYIRELIELGVLGDESSTQALRDQIAGLATDAEAALNKVERSALAAQGEAYWKKAVGVVPKTLAFGANLNNTISSNLRIGMFENELAVLREAYKGDETWTEARLKKEAAAKVLRTTQTHSQVFPVVTSFTKSGLGSLIAPFARFKAEVARVMIETVKLSSEERASDNEVIRKRGNQRLAGFLTTLTLMPLTVAGVVSLAFAAAFGDDEDVTADSILNYFLPRNGDELRRDQALREGLADWQKGNTVYFTQVGDKIRSLDMTFINPTAIYTDLIMRSYELIRTGKEAEIPAVAAKWVTGQLIGDQIAIGAAMESLNNKDEKGNPITTGDTPFLEALITRTTYALSQGYKPPVASFVENLMSGEKGSKKPVTEDDKASNRLEIFAGELLGVRPRVEDVSTYHNRAIRSAALTYSQSRRATGILKSRSPLDGDQITEAVQKANRARVAAFGRAAEMMRSYENMGMTRGQLFSTSNEAGFSKDRLNKALNNVTDRWTPSRDDLKDYYDAGQKADGNGAGRLKLIVAESLKYPAVQVLKP